MTYFNWKEKVVFAESIVVVIFMFVISSSNVFFSITTRYWFYRGLYRDGHVLLRFLKILKGGSTRIKNAQPEGEAGRNRGWNSIRREPSRVGFTRAYELIRRFFRCYAVNTRPTNPSMSAILNNSLFSPRSGRSDREAVGGFRGFRWEAIDKFRTPEFFFTKGWDCARR